MFLHEGLGSASTWRDFPDRLGRQTGCGVLLYSRAGYGRSQPVPLPRSVRFMHDEAAVLEEVLLAMRVREAVLFGHSDGASIALIHAGSAPGTGLRGLVLEAPHVFTEPHGLASIAAVAEVYRSGGLRDRLARHHGENTDVAFWGWNQVWLDPEFESWNIEGYLPSVAVPALVIQGTADEYGTWRQVEAIQARSGAAVEVLAIPGGGHSPHRSHPAEVLHAAEAFIRRTLGSTGL